jgi:hypothetical protein
MKLKRIMNEVVKEVADEEGIPEHEVWKVLSRIKERIDR